jgi:MFS family permease
MNLRRPKFTGLWRHPDFVKLWSGQTVSVFGSLISRTALPFTAILALDASPIQVAVLALADLIPGVLFGLVAGVWADRLRRRPIMIAADVGRALLLATVPLAWAFDALSIEQLYAVALGAGALTVCFDVAYLSYLPTLVKRDELVEGNSKLSASSSAAEIGAFGIAGWLVQLLNGPLAILVDAGTFVVSAATIGAIRAPEPPPPPIEDRRSAHVEIRDGIRQIVRDPVLRALAASDLLFQMSFRIFGAVFLLFVVRELDFKPGVLGVIFAVGGASSLVGAAVAGSLVRRIGVGPTMILGVLLAAGGQVLIPFAREANLFAVLVLIAGQLITDPGAVLYEINDVTLRQSVTPAPLLGRVNGTIRFGEFALMIAGTLLGGVLGEYVGLRAGLFAGITCLFAAALPLLLSPVRTLMSTPEPLGEVPAMDVVEVAGAP